MIDSVCDGGAFSSAGSTDRGKGDGRRALTYAIGKKSFCPETSGPTNVTSGLYMAGDDYRSGRAVNNLHGEMDKVKECRDPI